MNKTDHQTNFSLILLTISIFLISPVASLLLFILSNIYRRPSILEYKFFILLFSIFLGIINSGKILENDLINYEKWFIDAGSTPFIDYIFYQNKEPVFFIYNYVLHLITTGNFKLYLLINTTVCYFILGISLLRLHSYTRKSNYAFLISLFVLYLFPILFSLSAQLIRQFLAASLIVLIIVEISTQNRKLIPIFIASSLIHTTSVFFASIYLLDFFKKRKLSYTVTIVFCASTIILLIRFPYIFAQLQIGNPFIDYSLSRLSNINNSYVNLGTIGPLNLALFFFILSSFFMNKMKTNGDLRVFQGVNLLLLALVLATIKNPEVSIRFSFYFYFILPFAAYFTFNRIMQIDDAIIGPLILFFSLTLMSTWFVYKLYNGVWTYSEIPKTLFLWQ